MKKAIHTALPAFCRGGNLFFVGTKEENCHILRTSAGLIMIDVGSEANLPFVLDGMKELGLELKDLKILLLSHWHYDHSAAVPLLRRASEQAGGSFTTLIGERDEEFLLRECGITADGVLHDGEIVTLGETAIRCVASPGHTAGTTSFFFDVRTGGRTVSCGMFGGAGTNQLKADFLERYGITRLMRREFMQTLDRLSEEKPEQTVGNHSWNDHLPQNYDLWAERGFDENSNPFLDSTRWQTFLNKVRRDLRASVRSESVTRFVNYAHRGRSDLHHGNTMPAFLAGLEACANGIETDIRRTADGVLVLFHDKKLTGLGEEGSLVSETTFDELSGKMTALWGSEYRLVTLEDFLRVFGPLNLRLALELKADGIEEETAQLAEKYTARKDVTFTSFSLERLEKIHALLPDWHKGFLVKRGEAGDDLPDTLFGMGVEEICPFSADVTPEQVDAWHDAGLTVRAWGVPDEEEMKRLVDAGVDGMTVNFPQKLTAYLAEKRAGEQA